MSNIDMTRSLEGLPQHFVSAMRTLFDIMDDRNTGFVRLTDIESRWQESESGGLPKGVIESLRKVTPPNGLLSFERFCAGLKICLLRHKASQQVHPLTVITHPHSTVMNQREHKPLKLGVNRPASVPLPDRDQGGTKMGSKLPVPATVLRPNIPAEGIKQSHVNTATVRPNNAAVNRTVSMPQLQPESNNRQPPQRFQSDRNSNGLRQYHSETRIANAVVQNEASGMRQQQWANPTTSAGRLTNRSGILAALENWRNGMLNSEASGSDGRMFQIRAEKVATTVEGLSGNQRLGQLDVKEFQSDPVFLKKPIARSKSSSAVVGRTQENRNDEEQMQPFPETGPAARRAFNRRREPRRHTLASGIDYTMLKRMKQMEQERDVLLQGMEMIEHARDWYLAQITLVQDKMHFLGKNNYHSEYSTDVHQERLNLQMARILEVNRNITALIETSEKGHPLHMNLAVRSPVKSMQENFSLSVIHRLKEQNRMLTEEVGKKGERITQLEKEKSALVRELFQARSSNQLRIEDNTFM